MTQKSPPPYQPVTKKRKSKSTYSVSNKNSNTEKNRKTTKQVSSSAFIENKSSGQSAEDADKKSRPQTKSLSKSKLRKGQISKTQSNNDNKIKYESPEPIDTAKIFKHEHPIASETTVPIFDIRKSFQTWYDEATRNIGKIHITKNISDYSSGNYHQPTGYVGKMHLGHEGTIGLGYGTSEVAVNRPGRSPIYSTYSYYHPDKTDLFASPNRHFAPYETINYADRNVFQNFDPQGGYHPGSTSIPSYTGCFGEGNTTDVRGKGCYSPYSSRWL